MTIVGLKIKIWIYYEVDMIEFLKIKLCIHPHKALFYYIISRVQVEILIRKLDK